MKKNKKIDKKKIRLIILSLAGFTVIILATVLLFINFSNKNNKEAKNAINQGNDKHNLEKKIKSEPTKERAIDGILIAEDSLDFYPIAITIDNNEGAKPQIGLGKANLVIEAPVEGGITRFLAIFADSEDIKKIGPVRSARPYFLDWTKEFNALYCHVGGSPESLKLIKQGTVLDLDQYYKSRYYWRSSKRPRPHNVFTSSELLNKALKNYSLTEHNYSSLIFKDDFELEERGKPENDVIVNFSIGNSNLVVWKYNREENEYLRFYNENPHSTADGNVIKTKNLIIQKSRITSIDAEDRKKIETIGSGEAIIFLDGKIINGNWKKQSRKDRTKFYNQEDKEIRFNRGKFWIEIVSNEAKLLY